MKDEYFSDWVERDLPLRPYYMIRLQRQLPAGDHVYLHGKIYTFEDKFVGQIDFAGNEVLCIETELKAAQEKTKAGLARWMKLIETAEEE